MTNFRTLLIKLNNITFNLFIQEDNMKNIFKIITLIFILFQFWGCTEENIVNNYNERKSLVVVSIFHRLTF